MRDRAVGRILFGWSINVIIFFGLLFTFTLYGCQIYMLTAAVDLTGKELALSWAWSVMQRFVINEPILICAARYMPMLFTNAACANVCGESVANMIEVLVTGIAQCLKQLRP